jgi:protein-S-isoprenylcysteine O-methyltransferase Ste14
MRRALIAAYGGFAYLAGLASFVLFIAFVLGIGLPRSLDVGPVGPTSIAFFADLGFIALFGVQHSVMARGSFKRRLTSLLPPEIERSTFVLASGALLVALVLVWRPLPWVLYEVRSGAARTVVFAVALSGWALVFASSFFIDHFEMFGVRQTLLSPRADDGGFRTPLLYRRVRHPLYLGFVIAFWAAPTMTAGRLLFSACMTAYVFIGMAFEERDLIARFGDAYRNYRNRVRMILPLP